MRTFTAEHTPADIVNVFPHASDLFAENRIDFCCGGGNPLKETFSQDNIDEEAILSKLNEAYTEWKEAGNEHVDWNEVPLAELVDHIVTQHHDHVKQALPAVAGYVAKVHQVHGGPNHPHLDELYNLYNTFKTDMMEHTLKADEEVFPLILEYADHPSPELLKDIHEANGDFEAEHEATSDVLKRMRVITNGYAAPAHACGTYQMMYDRLAEIETDTFQHIHLENNILFKRL